MKKSLIVVVLTLLVLSGCTAITDNNNTEVETVAISDALGAREIRVNPSRVAIFSFDILDIIDSVGLEKFNIDLLGMPQESVPANLSQYKDATYKNIGTLFEANYDELDLFDPQLIIVSNRSITLVEELTSKYPNADILDASLPDYQLRVGMEKNVENLAKIFPDAAESLHGNFNKITTAMDEMASKTSQVNAMFLLVNANAISFYGPAGRYAMIHNEFGYGAADENTEEGGNHGKAVSFEYVLETNPEVLFLMDRGASIGNEATIDDVKNNDVLNQTDAALNNDMYTLEPISWYITSGGFASAIQMLHDMNQYLESIDQGIEIPTLN